MRLDLEATADLVEPNFLQFAGQGGALATWVLGPRQSRILQRLTSFRPSVASELNWNALAGGADQSPAYSLGQK